MIRSVQLKCRDVYKQPAESQLAKELSTQAVVRYPGIRPSRSISTWGCRGTAQLNPTVMRGRWSHILSKWPDLLQGQHRETNTQLWRMSMCLKGAVKQAVLAVSATQAPQNYFCTSKLRGVSSVALYLLPPSFCSAPQTGSCMLLHARTHMHALTSLLISPIELQQQWTFILGLRPPRQYTQVNTNSLPLCLSLSPRLSLCHCSRGH